MKNNKRKIFYVVSLCIMSGIHAHDKKFPTKPSAPIDIPTSPRAAQQNTYQPLSPASSFVSPSSSLIFPFSPESSSLSVHQRSSSCSPQQISAQPLLARSVCVSPSSSYPAIPSSFSPVQQQYEQLSPSRSCSASPSAPDFTPANSTYGNSFSAAATMYMPSVEQRAAQQVTNFKQFLKQYSDADRAKFITPLLEVLNCDACLVVAKVAAEKGTKNSDNKPRNLYTISRISDSTLPEPLKNAQLALAALKAALPEQEKKKK